MTARVSTTMIVVALMAPACKGDASSAKSRQGQDDAAESGSASSAPSGPPTPTKGRASRGATLPGPAYFATQSSLLVISEDGATSRVEASGIRSLSVEPDGALFVLTSLDVQKLEGDKLVSIAKSTPPGLSRIAVDGDGRVWGVAEHDVYRHDGTAWQRFPEAELHPKVPISSLASVAIDDQGEVWLAAGTSEVFHKGGGAWSGLDLGKTSVFGVLGAEGGGAWIASDAGIGRVDATSVKSQPAGTVSSPRRFALGANGAWAAYDRARNLVSWAGAGKKESLPFEGYPAVDALAADALGRAWICTERGLLVLVGAAGPNTVIPTGKDIAEPVVAAAVVGAGPKTLPAALTVASADESPLLNDVEDIRMRLRGETPPAPSAAPPSSSASAAPPGGTIGNAGAVVAGMAPAFRRCYTRALSDDPTTSGSVRITARIGPAGEVVSAKPTGATTLPPALVACVAGVVSSRSFPNPDGGGATIVIPVTFAPPP